MSDALLQQVLDACRQRGCQLIIRPLGDRYRAIADPASDWQRMFSGVGGAVDDALADLLAAMHDEEG